LKDGGQAGSLGVRNGDILIGINGSPLHDGTSLNGFASKIKKLSAPPTVVIWRSPQRISEFLQEEAHQRKADALKAQKTIETARQQPVHNENMRQSACVDSNANNASIAALTNMGFTVSQAEKAIRKSMGNLEVAVEMLLNDAVDESPSPSSSPQISPSSHQNMGVSFQFDLSGSIGVSFKAPRGSLKKTNSDGGMDRRANSTSQLVITSIEKGSSAQIAGCKVGDTVVAVANIHVTSVLDLKNALQEVRESGRKTTTVTAVPSGGDIALVLTTLNLDNPEDRGEVQNEALVVRPSEDQAAHRVGCMQHIASGSMVDLADEKSCVRGLDNFACKEYSVVFTEARVGISLERTDDGRLAVASSRFAAAKKGVAVGDVLCGMNNSALSFGMEQTLVHAMIDSAERPLVLNFWRAGTDSEKDVGVYFGPNVSSLGLELELSEEGKWTVEGVEGISFVRGLKVGDIIIGVNHWPLPEFSDLFAVLSNTIKIRPLILNVLVSNRRPVAIRGDHLIGDLLTDEQIAAAAQDDSQDDSRRRSSTMRKTCLL